MKKGSEPWGCSSQTSCDQVFFRKWYGVALTPWVTARFIITPVTNSANDDRTLSNTSVLVGVTSHLIMSQQNCWKRWSLRWPLKAEMGVLCGSSVLIYDISYYNSLFYSFSLFSPLFIGVWHFQHWDEHIWQCYNQTFICMLMCEGNVIWSTATDVLAMLHHSKTFELS